MMNENKQVNENQTQNTKRTSSIQRSFQGRKFRNGAYASIVSAIVVILVIVINVFITDLDLKVDASKKSYYTLTDTTKEIVKSIEDDIVIYYIAQTSNQLDLFKGIIDKYDSLSSKIKVVSKDPILNPQFASAYTEEEVEENSVIVVNEANGRSKYVSNSEMLKYSMDSSTYETYLSGIDVEGQLTSAIQYVTDENLPIVYQTVGHSEEALGERISAAIDKQNIELSDIDLLKVEAIPDDCDILLINGISSDLTTEEFSIIKDYLTKGGKLILNVDYFTNGLENVANLLDYCGIELVQGIAVEGNKDNYMSNYPNFLLPNIETHDITSAITSAKKSVLVLQASGLREAEAHRSSLTIEPILSTSDDAYSKINLKSETIVKEENDIAGPFYLGVKATDSYNNVTSQVVVYGTRYLVSDDIPAALGNDDLFIQTISKMVGKESSLNIPSKSILTDYITTNQQQTIIWSSIVCVLLPLSFLITGIVISVRRRRG